jgi:hypothetical protein
MVTFMWQSCEVKCWEPQPPHQTNLMTSPLLITVSHLLYSEYDDSSFPTFNINTYSPHHDSQSCIKSENVTKFLIGLSCPHFKNRSIKGGDWLVSSPVHHIQLHSKIWDTSQGSCMLWAFLPSVNVPCGFPLLYVTVWLLWRRKQLVIPVVASSLINADMNSHRS